MEPDIRTEHDNRIARITAEVTLLKQTLNRAAAQGPSAMTVILTAELMPIIDPATLRHLAADYAIQVDRLTQQTARLHLHRRTINVLHRNLAMLPWWSWRRRRNIEHQLAHIAITLGEPPT